jgi:hypothetical protein
MHERSLHAAVKDWYSQPGDELEALVDGYVVDILRGDLLIEIQTGNFSSIRNKLAKLIRRHQVRLVHPISRRKWIVRVGKDGETILSRRKSPKRGRIEDLFHELVYVPDLFKNPNISLEALFVHSEDVLIDDGRGSWRRRHWSIHDRRLLDVVESVPFVSQMDFARMLPSTLSEHFTTGDLVTELKVRPNIARRMAYCLRKMGLIEVVGKRGRALLYMMSPEM